MRPRGPGYIRLPGAPVGPEGEIPERKGAAGRDDHQTGVFWKVGRQEDLKSAPAQSVENVANQMEEDVLNQAQMDSVMEEQQSD